jgi:hypothetical protein
MIHQPRQEIAMTLKEFRRHVGKLAKQSAKAGKYDEAARLAALEGEILQVIGRFPDVKGHIFDEVSFDPSTQEIVEGDA